MATNMMDKGMYAAPIGLGVDSMEPDLEIEIENPDDKCGLNKIIIKTNMSSIKTVDLGSDVNKEYNPGF